MIDFNNLPEFTGFTVYHFDTGEPIENEEIAKELGCRPELADDMALTESGWLYFTDSAGNWYSIPKEGKYIIQLGCGENFRW